MDLFIAIGQKLISHSIKEIVKNKDFVERVISINTPKRMKNYFPIERPSVLLVDSWQAQKNKGTFVGLVNNLMDEPLCLIILSTIPHERPEDYQECNVYDFIPFHATFRVIEKKLRRYSINNPRNAISYVQNKLSESTLAELHKRTRLRKLEIQILYLVCKDYSSAEIGKMFFMKKKTVENYRHILCQKLGCTSAMGCVKYAIRHNLFPDF